MPRFEIQKGFRDFVEDEATAEITSQQSVDLESLPTRIDLNSEEVLGALDAERTDAVTRIVSEDDSTRPAPSLRELSSSSGALQAADTSTKIATAHRVDEGRSTSFSREETARIKSEGL